MDRKPTLDILNIGESKPMTPLRVGVLDHGFVQLLNISGPTRRNAAIFDGDDTDPANAARMSFNQVKLDRTREMDLKLCDYLMKNKHTSPFEMVEVWVEMKMPIFVARQFVRHRTACINEVSGRYVQLPAEWYIPEKVGKKASDKKQGQTDGLYWQTEQQFKEDLNRVCEQSYQLYNNAIMTDVAPEHARMLLHLNHYTHWIWKQDLHNLMHFLSLRVDSHAQIEAQKYAEAVIQLLRPHLPHSMALFDKYRRIQASVMAATEIGTMLGAKSETVNAAMYELSKEVDFDDGSVFKSEGLKISDEHVEMGLEAEKQEIEAMQTNTPLPVEITDGPIIYSDMVRELAKPGEDIIKGLVPVSAHALHMAIGLMGEVTELLTAYLNKDRANMVEELGDIEFFFLGLFQCGEMRSGESMYNLEIIEFEPHKGLMNQLLIEAGEILDVAKRVTVYNDPNKWPLFADRLPRFRVALNMFYEYQGISVDEAIEHNVWKLAKGPKARYKGGKYSDAAAQNRADKA